MACPLPLIGACSCLNRAPAVCPPPASHLHSPPPPCLQARAIVAFGLLLCMRVLNLAVPILFKRMVDSFAPDQPEGGGGGAHYTLCVRSCPSGLALLRLSISG